MSRGKEYGHAFGRGAASGLGKWVAVGLLATLAGGGVAVAASGDDDDDDRRPGIEQVDDD